MKTVHFAPLSLLPLALLPLALLIAAAPAERSSDQFLADARALVARDSPEAVTSPEADALRQQMAKAARTARAQIGADLANGTLANVCLRAPGTTQISLGEVIAGLGALTADQRALPLSKGMALFLGRRFPCPAR